jgi:hypothetical protein
MPAALIKTTYEKNFIVSEAKQCVTQAVTNVRSVPELLAVLAECSRAKSGPLAEFALASLAQACQAADAAYFNGDSESVRGVGELLVQEVTSGKRIKMKKTAENIL